jgi:hypothetical protein
MHKDLGSNISSPRREWKRRVEETQGTKVPPRHTGTLTNAAQREKCNPRRLLPAEMTEF